MKNFIKISTAKKPKTALRTFLAKTKNNKNKRDKCNNSKAKHKDGKLFIGQNNRSDYVHARLLFSSLLKYVKGCSTRFLQFFSDLVYLSEGSNSLNLNSKGFESGTILSTKLDVNLLVSTNTVGANGVKSDLSTNTVGANGVKEGSIFG